MTRTDTRPAGAPRDRRTPVRGHWCVGLREHFDAARRSHVPRFTPSGAIRSSDDLNAVVIQFCPYCGERLGQPSPSARPTTPEP